MINEEGPIMHATRKYLALAKPRPLIGNPLLKVLRCPYMYMLDDVGFDLSDEIPEQDRADLTICLPKLLGEVMDMSGSYQREVACSLLVGLQHSGAFSAYPRDEESAYVLAGAVLFYIDHFIPNFMMDALTKEYIVGLLNAWIMPVAPWSDLPGARTVCKHLFGDAWTTLVLPDACDDEPGGFTRGGRNYTVDDVVRRERPPFQPWLCDHVHLAIEALPLPDGVSP